MANGPDEKHLPENKKDSFKDDIGKKVTRTLTDAYRDLRRHEVSKGDAREIVGGGSNVGFSNYEKETSKE